MGLRYSAMPYIKFKILYYKILNFKEVALTRQREISLMRLLAHLVLQNHLVFSRIHHIQRLHLQFIMILQEVWEYFRSSL